MEFETLRRVLVAGGAGFIGSHVVDRLLASGIEVVAIDNLVTGRIQNLDQAREFGHFHLLEHDITQTIPSTDCMDERFDVIFNFASPASPADFEALSIEILRVGSLGTENLLKRAVTDKAIFVQVSTSEVYGDPLVHPQVETYLGNVSTIGPRSCYDEAKRYAEALTIAYHRRFGLSVRIPRVFNTYGPRMRANDGRVVSNFLSQVLRGEPLTVFGSGTQTRSFCYVDDLVDGLLLLVQHDYQEPINLGNPQEFTIIELAQLIMELIDGRGNISRHPIPSMRDGDPQQRRPDISRARSVLGWEPKVLLQDGVKRMVSHFQKEDDFRFSKQIEVD